MSYMLNTFEYTVKIGYLFFTKRMITCEINKRMTTFLYYYLHLDLYIYLIIELYDDEN